MSGLPLMLLVTTLLQDQPVSQHGINLFATPVALCRGDVVIVSVEENGPGRDRLKTVVRIGSQQTTLEERTLIDDYHAQPSVGVDPRGRIHVAYNMHNMPWQYVVSREPCRIDAFDFRGEAVTDQQLHEVAVNNRSPFPGPGAAAIPGNQITYPAFFNDRHGDLYVTYRYAVRPAAAWREREFAGAIARFNAATGEWRQIGGSVADSHPFAWEPGWTAYPPRLWFDARNAMHATWTWREGEAGQDTTRPSYAMLSEGSASALPMRLPEGRGERVNALISVTTEGSTPLAVMQPVGGERLLMTYDSPTRRWRSLGASPYGASSVLCDDDGTCWAYASGPRVLVRKQKGAQWKLVYEGRGYCDPKPLHDAATGRHLLHVTRCDQRAISVLELGR